MFSSVDSGTSMRDAAADEAQGKNTKSMCATYIDEFNFPCYLSSISTFLDRGLQGLFHVIVCFNINS